MIISRNETSVVIVVVISVMMKFLVVSPVIFTVSRMKNSFIVEIGFTLVGISVTIYGADWVVISQAVR